MEGSNEIKEETKPIEAGPSRSNDLSKTLPEEAFNNFLQGKRNMLVQDYSFAVQSLATACEMYTQHFGEMALECGEIHYLYGKALFRLSQQEAGVLGDALNDEVNEEDEDGKSSEEDSKENESEKNDSDTEENGEENQDEAVAEEEKEPSESTDSPQAMVVDDTKEQSEKSDEQAPPAEADTTIKEEEEAEEASGEEEDDLELAWNSLETAKSIFLRQGEDNVEAQLRVADILQLLAEISMETDNNTAAIADLKVCLNIKKKHLKPDDRLLAETYYQMGLAQMLEKLYPPALRNFTTTIEILELRKENLKNTIIPDVVGSFAKADREKEIDELDSVLADIKEKVEDTKELIRDAKKKAEELQKAAAAGVEEVGFPSPEKSENVSKPVSNITHLLKRKKPELEDDKERESKRSKMTSNVQNGDAMVKE